MPLVRAVANTAIAIYLIVFGIGCFVVAVMQYHQQQALHQQRDASAAFTHCTAEWQDDFLSAYKARSNASVAVNHAMDRVMQAVSDQDPAAFHKALHNYLTVRARQNEERASNPLPPLPSVRCGS